MAGGRLTFHDPGWRGLCSSPRHQNATSWCGYITPLSAPHSSPRSTLPTTSAQNLFPRSAPLQSCGGQEWARRNTSLVELPKCQMLRNQKKPECRVSLQLCASRVLVNPKFLQTPFLRTRRSLRGKWEGEGTNKAVFECVGKNSVSLDLM